MEKEINLHDCIDARIWAKEFSKMYPVILKDGEGATSTEELMIGWFANSIMAGVDEANRRKSPSNVLEKEMMVGELVNIEPKHVCGDYERVRYCELYNKVIEEISALKVKVPVGLALNEEILFEIISKHNTGNPDRFYDPKAMAEDRQMAIDICENFSVPAGREVDEKKLEEIYDKAIMDADLGCGDGNASPYEKKYTIIKAIKTALESGHLGT